MRRIFLTLVLLGLLVLLFSARSKPVGQPQGMAQSVTPDAVSPAGSPVNPTPTPAPEGQTQNLVQTPNPTTTDPDLAVFTSDAFKQTELARRWAEQGVAEADIASALRKLRNRGFSGSSLRDPALVAQFLPARNVRPVMVESIALPATAPAGQPVPFSVNARFPSPAYQFESWNIQSTGTTVTVRPVGTLSADPVASVVVPVKLEGALPGLDAGRYNVRFEAIGDPVERSLSVQSR